MSKSIRTHRRQLKANGHRQTIAGGVNLPLRRTWPLSLCIGLLLGSIVVSGDALAGGPTGGAVVGGAGSITQKGNSTVINQASNKLALNWNTFNVAANESVLFNQPSKSAVALNRILDQSPSRIFGRISSNGQVFLINTHGIIFGSSAQLNVGGLLASTLDLTPKDFLAGHYNLKASGPSAGVVNHGLIQAASGGSVALVGGSVANDGLIFANYGKINLDGAEQAVLDFDGNGLINIRITGELKDRLEQGEAAVSNKGTLRAEDGTVVLQASAAKNLFTNLVNNSGVIDAGSISTDGGVVRLVASGGNVMNGGDIDVTGVRGGSVQMLSDRNVGVTGGNIDASGVSGGGDIRIGGGWQGGEGLRTAQAVYVGPDATLKADASHKGDGGSVVVWGDSVNNFFGDISARGGVAGGDGGRVETSAHDALNVWGTVDASAPAGKAGSWLLDPYDVTLVNGTGGALSGPSSDRYFSAAADNSLIGIDVIEGALLGGSNVSIFTGTGGTQEGNITVAGAIDAPGRSSLYLKAAGSIYVDENISGISGSGPLDLHLWANYGGTADALSYTGRADCLTCEVLVGRSNGAIGINISRGVLDIRTGDTSHTGGKVRFGNGTSGSTGSVHAGEFSIHAQNIDMGWGNYQFNVQDTTLDAGNGNIALTGNELSFDGDLSVTGGLITLGGGTPDTTIKADSQSYQGPVVLDNDVILDSSSGNGAVHVIGTVDNATATARALTIKAGSGAVTFDGAVGSGSNGALDELTVTGGAFDAASMAIGDGGLSITTSQGDIRQSGAFAVAGKSAFDAGTHAIKLDHAGNTFDDVVTAAGQDVSLADADDLTITSLDNGTDGEVSLIAGGSLTLPASDIDTGTANLTLAANGGSLTTSGALSGADLHLTGRDGITLNHDLDSTGTLTLEAEGAINQAGGRITATTLDLSSVGGASLLGNNQLTNLGSVTNTGSGGLSFANGKDLNLSGALNVGTAGGHTIDLHVVGDLTQSSGSVITADVLGGSASGSAMLDGGNQLNALGAFSAQDLSLRNAKALMVSGPISVPGTLSLTTTNGALNLSSDLAASTVELDSAGALTLAHDITADSLSLIAGGAINQTGGALAVTGGTTVDAGAHAVALTSAGNDFEGAVTASGTGISIRDANDLTVDGLNNGTNGDVSLVAGGALTLSGAIDSGTGALTLQSGGLLSIDDALTGGQVSLTGAGGINLGADVAVGGDLALHSIDHAIQQTSGVLSVQGSTTVNAGTGMITLLDVGNDFGGTVNLTGGITRINDINALSLGALATGALTVTSHGDLNLGTGAVASLDATSNNGAVSQIGALTVAGLGRVDAGTGAITLTDAGNDFGGTVDLAGGITRINDNNTLSLGTLATDALTVTSHGDLNLGTGTVASLEATSNNGAVSQSGALTVSGIGQVDAGTGAITLTDAGNDFGGALSLAGGTTRINDKNGLSLGTLATGALSVTSHGDLGLGQGRVASLDADSTDHAISQGGALVVTGASHVDAGSKAITLTDAGNDFGGVVDLHGGATQITDKNALTLGELTAGALTVASHGVLNLGHGAVGGKLIATSDGHAIGQSGALSVAGASTIDAGTAAVTLENAGNDFVGTMSVTGTGISIVDQNDLVIADLANGANGAVSLIAGGTLSLPASAIDTGSSDLRLVSRGDALTTPGSLSGANIHLEGRDGVALNNDVSTPGELQLLSGAGITQGAGVIRANTLTGSSVGDTVLDGANRIDTLGAFSAANFALTNAQTLAVTGPLTSSGDIRLATTAGELLIDVALAGDRISLTSADDLALSQDIDGNVVELGSGGDIVQSAGSIGSGVLQGHAAGSVALGQGNRIDSLGPFDAGNGFSLVNDQALSVDGAVSGGAGTARITTTAGGLSVAAGVKGASVDLAARDDLVIGATVDSGAGATHLASAAGVIREDGAGRVVAGSLAGQSAGSTRLDGANLIGSVDSFSAAGFSLANAQALTVAGPLDGGADIGLTIAGDLFINGKVNAATVALDAAGDLGEGAQGTITADMLSGRSSGTTRLDGANRIRALGGFSAAGFSLVNARGLAVVGPLDGGASTRLVTTAGDLAINGQVAGTSTTLQSAGAIREGKNGAVTAATLEGRSAGATMLNGANHIDSLGQFAASSFELANAQALAVNGALDGGSRVALTTTAGDLAINDVIGGTAVELHSAGVISEGKNGRIHAATLSGSSTDATRLDRANQVAVLGDFSSDGFSLANARSLAVDGQLDGGSSTRLTISAGDLAINQTLSGDVTTLSVAGSISEGADGRIMAGTLGGRSGGATRLDGANRIDNLGKFTAAGFSLVNAKTLSVRGALDGGASTALTTTAGDLAIQGAVSGKSIRLDAAAAISQGAKGGITAAQLTGRSGKATQLGGDNHVDQLGSFKAAGFSLANAQSLDVTGVLDGGAKTSLAVQGDLSIDGTVRGGATSLEAGGTIDQASDGSIVADVLNGRSGGATTLNGDNHLGSVGSFTAAGFELTNARSLTASGTLDGGNNTRLVITAGDLIIDGTVVGKHTLLDVAGDIDEGAAGTVVADRLGGGSGGATRLDGANRIGTLERYSASGFGLVNAQSLTVGGPVQGGKQLALTTTAGDLAINGAIKGGSTTLTSAGTIREGTGGSITAGTLAGRSTGATVLDGSNHVDTLGDFSAASLTLTNAQTLGIAGQVHGGANALLATTRGDIAIDGALAASTVRLESAGAITESKGGSITAGTLSGQANGPTMLGDAATHALNKIDTLGNFSSTAGFSLTNDKTLTLASVDGSAFTVDAGTSSTYLGVSNGDLLQLGTTWLYNGSGTWDSTGRIGTSLAPIYVTGVSMQTVSFVGMPPAYFYALDRNGGLLPLGGSFAVNVPTASGAGSAQNGNHGNVYIDPAIITANYRAYGIVPSGVRLPADQKPGCDPDDPDQLECEEGDSFGMLLDVRR